MSQNSIHNHEQFKEIHHGLETLFVGSLKTIGIQRQIYAEFITIFVRFNKSLNQLSQKINEQILNNQKEQATVNTYQFLSNCLLRMAECSRKVAIKGKNQVLDPLEMFGKNYEHVFHDMLSKLHGCLAMISKSEHNLIKSRESYISAAQKLQKYKETHNRILSKIENGDLTELQKFNATTRKLTDSINETEKNYKQGAIRLNKDWEEARTHLSTINVSMEYNEQSRISFTRRSVQSSIKLLEEFNNAFDNSCTQKLQQSNNRMLQTEKKQNSIDKRLLAKIALLINASAQEEFISYEQMSRRRKKSMLEQESVHLLQIFSKVPEKDKKLLKEIIKPWFLEKQRLVSKTESEASESSSVASKDSPNKKEIQLKEASMMKSQSMGQLKKMKNTSQLSQKKQEKPKQQKPNDTQLQKSQSANQQIALSSPSRRKANLSQLKIDECKGKVLSFQPYSFYFVEILYQNISEMPSFYCKVQEDDFLLLLNFFSTISKNLNLESETNLQLLFKMIQISQRVVKKRIPIPNGKGQPIELLCYPYGKICECLKNQKNLKLLLKYLERRRGLKKKILQPEKNMVMGLAKGFFSAVTRRKDSLPNLNDDEKFNCLQELTSMMANLGLPNQLSLTFIKKELENNQSTYDYLKGIILAKRDQEERYRLMYKREVKQKRQETLRRVVDNKSVAVYCLSIVAKRGLLNVEDVGLRLVHKSLRNIHLEIIHNLRIPTNKKWPQLIPYDKKINYLAMKTEVAENSVPSSVEQIITLDVNRSLHLHGEYFNPTLLHSLLRVYAYYHTDISYCQGMNYIAGYIYIKTLAEESAYRIFQHVMEVRFKELFMNEFRLLKTKMYQFERLLSIFHPDIADHFKRQGISPECYIVSWMITLFASTYQYTMHSHVVDVLWQRFIIYGWREFYKFILWLFSMFKEDLLEMTYDKALHFLGEMSRSQMFVASEECFRKQFQVNVQQQVNKFEVTDQMLQGFLKQYNLN